MDQVPIFRVLTYTFSFALGFRTNFTNAFDRDFCSTVVCVTSAVRRCNVGALYGDSFYCRFAGYPNHFCVTAMERVDLGFFVRTIYHGRDDANHVVGRLYVGIHREARGARAKAVDDANGLLTGARITTGGDYSTYVFARVFLPPILLHYTNLADLAAGIFTKVASPFTFVEFEPTPIASFEDGLPCRFLVDTECSGSGKEQYKGDGSFQENGSGQVKGPRDRLRVPPLRLYVMSGALSLRFLFGSLYRTSRRVVRGHTT